MERLECRRTRAGARRRGAVPRAGLVLALLGAWIPVLVPVLASSPAESAAEADLRAAREALERSRTGISAEIIARPRLDLIARDDPPRPLESDLELDLGASLSWSPLRSEILLNEARVLEAERRLLTARRDAVVRELRLRVERARADAAVHGAEAARDEALAEVARARRVLDEASPPGRPPGGGERTAPAPAEERAAAARRRLARAELDLRDALLDLADARRSLRALGGAPTPMEAWSAGAERPDLRLPVAADVRDLRVYRAREHRHAAAIAREERRRIDAFLPNASLEAGYAGSDAALSAGLALAGGRPRGHLEAGWTGTPQERAWARFSFTLRLGTDAADAATSPEEMAAAAHDDLRARARELATDVRERRAEAEARRDRWLLSEATLALERDEGDPARIRRALDAARRDWLRFLRAVDAASDALEVPLVVR